MKEESSEEEAPKKKAANGAAKPAASSSDDDSDSDSEEEEEKPAAKKAAAAAKKADSSDDGSSDDSSDEESSEEEDDDEEEKPKRKEKAAEAPAAKKPRVEVEAADGEEKSSTVFVGNLPWSATEEELREFFAECGDINTVRIATDAETGRARGFCHIEFSTPEAAAKAQADYNGSDYGGRALKVDVSQPRGSAPRKSFGGEGAEDGTTVFVKGFDTSEGEDAVRAALEETFGSCGEIARVRLPSDRDSGELKGFAYIEFGDAAAKAKAAELDGSEACGGYLKVDVNVAPRTPGGGGGGFGGRGGGRGFGGRGGGRF
ncbi:MAG: hypothetical protein J3K34DRAFT_237619, partial [Monoraphidium minutum]